MSYQNYYNPYQTTIPAPMDRLQQLQQQYQVPQMQQIPQVPQIMPQQQSNGILWVQGEAAAKSYLVAPGTSVLLMDSDESAFYIKTVDPSGMPQPLRVFKYTEVGGAVPAAQEPAENMDEKYVTKAEFNALMDKYKELCDLLEEASKPRIDLSRKGE